MPYALPDIGTYDAGAAVSYQVDLFGKISRGLEAANADAEAAQAAYDLARVNVAAGTVRAYAEACAAGQQLEVAQHSIALQEQFAELTRKRAGMGRGTSLDVSRAQGQLEQLRAAVPPLEAQRATSLYRLAVLVGKVPGTLPVSWLPAMPRLPFATPSLSATARRCCAGGPTSARPNARWPRPPPA